MNIEGIILAAGYSRRADTHKMILEIDGKTILERCLLGMYDICSKIIIVGGYKIDNLIPLCKRYSKVKLIYNDEFSLGMFSSVKSGLKHISSDKFFLTPGDYPLINISTYETLKSAQGEIVVPEYKGQKGHPILIRSIFIPEILSSNQYRSLREFIQSKKVNHLNITDPGILMDLDTLTDYQHLLSYYQENYK